MKKKFIKFSALFLLISLILIVCSSNKNNLTENEKTIEKVLVNFMTHPNPELDKAIADYPDDVIAGNVNENDEPEYSRILKKLYQSHFTKEGYKDFILKSVMTNQAYMEKNYLLTKVKNVKIDQNSRNVNRYKFTADIEYTDKKNKTGIKKIEGNAEFKEKGKLDAFGIMNLNSDPY